MQTQTAEKLQYKSTDMIKITKEEVENASSLSPLCRGCRNMHNYKCKKNLVPKPKFLGGEKCGRHHPILKT